MFWFKKLEILQFYPFSASSTATATETVAPTMGLLPNPMGKRGLMACLETAPYTLKAAGIPGGSANVRM